MKIAEIIYIVMMAKSNRKITLRVFIEKPIVYSGCGRIPFKEDDYRTLPSAKYHKEISNILKKVHMYFQDQINIEVIDPRNILFLLDVLRYGVKANKPLWIVKVDRKSVYILRENPDADVLIEMINNLVRGNV